ncbi:MAG: hypothetical protein RL323_2175 [Pseudomonadota bacterium]
MTTNFKKCLWVATSLLVATAILIYHRLELGQLLTLDNLRASKDSLTEAYQLHPTTTMLGFLGVYVLSTALSFPGAVVLTLGAGALFGFWKGLVLASFASTWGALLAFLATRYLLRDKVQARFGQAVTPINQGMQADGVFYLLALRLAPVFPFWLINLLMGLTPISAWRFYWVSQVGMLAGTAVYVNAGTELAAIKSASDVLSPSLLGSLMLLGTFPLLVKQLLNLAKRRKVYAKWPKPARFDRNLVVIGAGAGGLVTAYIAAAVKAKVTLVEGHKMGGDCLNQGCVPSKALIRSATMAKQLTQASELGLVGVAGHVDFAAVMKRIKNVVRAIEPHDSVERYTRLGVEVMQGHARLTSPWSVAVTLADGSQQTLTTRNIVIAAGATPLVPALPGLNEAGFLTSDTVWDLAELPKRLVVMGGGPIGCELAQSFARLGSKVTLVEMAPRVLVREDAEVSELLAKSLRDDQVNVLTAHQAVRVEVVDGEKCLITRHDDHETAIPFDQVLCALGRTPRTTGYGLEELGIPLTRRSTIETNAYLQTLYPNIYAVGDVAGPFQFTHTASHQAWYAAVNALFGGIKRFKADYSVIPWATFTDPEIARVGLTETEAAEQGIPCEITRYAFDDLDRAIVDGTARGFVKVLTVPGKDKILGATIVGSHAAEILIEFVQAMKHGLGLNKILGTIHIYPTLSEANKYAAGEWKRAHAPQKWLQWSSRYLDWKLRH